MSRALAAVVAAAGLAAGCARPQRDVFLTYFNGDHAVSVQYPAGWRSDQALQDGVFYRYFLAPETGPGRAAVVSATLLAGPAGSGIDAYAERYLAGEPPTQVEEVERPGGRGKRFRFAAAEGKTLCSLLLLQSGPRVVGVYSQGDAAPFERYRPTVEAIERSLTLEQVDRYTEHRSERFRFAIRVPPSWQETRDLSGRDNLLLQYASPALLADPGPQVVRASLTLTVEPIPNQGDLDALYDATRKKLGEPFKVLSHAEWRGGYADLIRVETSIAVSRAKRYYRAAEGRGYILAVEARDDAFPVVSPWADLIASTLEVGSELDAR